MVKYFGFTQDSLYGSYILVMKQFDINLRKYLQKNHNQLGWKERIQITFNIINAIQVIHQENVIHKDLHSGNVLYLHYRNYWYISDLGFCGPANKPLKSVYGNLPYIAPEVMHKKEYTFASDIYSIAMLMWEISSGQPPFNNYEHDYKLATRILNGQRPEIVPGTPLGYIELMEQCWNANPLKRPNINILYNDIREIKRSYENENQNHIKIDINDNQDNQINKDSSVNILKNPFSRLYIFKDISEPRNVNEGNQNV